MSVKGGSIYYTVGIDRKTLADAMKQINALGKAAASANGAYVRSNKVLNQYADEVRKVSTAMKTLSNDFKRGNKDEDVYRREMAALEGQANTLRTTIESLGGSVVSTSQDQARAADLVKQLSSAQKEAAAVVSGSKGAYDSLGNGMDEVSANLVELNAQTRNATQRFEAGKISAEEYKRILTMLEVSFQAAGQRINTMTKGLNLNAQASKRVAVAQGQVTRGLTAIQKGTTRATGSMTSMALAQQLSYGGMTLLNDRIFQMSPALGILTNQLMFTTKGFKAWLTAMLPILAVAGSIIAAIATLAVSLRSGAGLEAALANVRKTTNLTTEELGDLTGRFQELAKEVPISTMELLEMAQVAGQLGIKGVDNVARFSATVAKLAVATNVVGEEGATSLARFLQATGTEMNQMGIEAERAANVLNELENNTAATADEILQMTSYTQGLAAQSGFTKDEILGLNAALLSLGVKAEAGGSAVVRTLGKIQVAGSNGGDALERFAAEAGVSVERFRDMARNSPVDALLALTKGLNETAENGGNLNDVLTDLGIIEVRERRALLALAQGYDTLQSAMRTAGDQSRLMNSLQAEVAIQSDTLVSKLKLLGARFVTIGQNIGQALVPMAKALVDVLITLADNLDVAAVAAIAFAAAIGVARFASIAATAAVVVGRLSGVVLGLSNAFLTLRLAFQAGGIANLVAVIGTSLPLAAAVAAAAVGGGLYFAFKKFYGEGVNVTEAMEDATEAVARFNDISVLAGDALDELTEATDENGFNGAFDRLLSTLNNEGQGAMRDFAESTLAPLLAQGKLKEATQAVTEEFLLMRIAAADAAYQANLSLRDTIEAQLRNARADRDLVAALLEKELASSRQRRGHAEFLADSLADAEVRVNELTNSLYNQEVVLDASTAAYQALNVALYELRELGLPIEQVIENLRKQFDELSGVTGVPDPDDEVEKVDDIAAAWDRLAAARAEIAEKAKVYGWDEKRQAEELAGVVSSAIDTLIGLGVRLDNTSFANLVTEWENLNNGIITAAVSLSEFERRQLALRSAQERRFSGESGEAFTIAAVAASARSFEEAMTLLERAGFEVDAELLDLVSTLRNESIPAMYAIKTETEASAKAFDDLKEAADRASSIGAFPGVGGYSEDRAAAGQAMMPNWLQAAAAARAEEVERVGDATADYVEKLRQVEALYAAGLIDREEYLNQQIDARNTMMRVLATSTIDYTERLAGLKDETEDLTGALEDLVEVQEKYNKENEKTEGVKGGKDGVSGSIARGTQAIRDQAEAMEDLRQATLDYEDGLAELDAQLSLGLISSQDYLSGQLALAEARLTAVAEATGWYSRATAIAADEVKRLRIEIDRLNISRSGGGGGDGGTEGPEKYPEREPGSAAEYLGGLKVADTALKTFALTVANAAIETSSLVSAVANSIKVTENDKGGFKVALDPMMLFAQILMDVIGKSEAFGKLMETLDGVLDPLVRVADALFGALQPVVEVAVALVTTALTPLVWIIETVVAPLLIGIGNVIKAVWNAIAKVFGLPLIEDAEDGDEGEVNRPGSIAYYEDVLQQLREAYNQATTDAARENYKRQIEEIEEMLEEMRGDNPAEGSLAYLQQQLADLREQYQNATTDAERAALLEEIKALEEAIDAMKEAAGEIVDNGGDNVSVGANISEITGPTRDLLMDLLRPLSILPSWTQMIQDIRNDVRAIATGGSLTAPMLSAGRPPAATANAGTTVIIQNATIETQAKDARSLYRELSMFAFREKRGGK